jgi:hypothetical protein
VPRDEFGYAIKETLAKRVAYRCSKPECRSLTVGPHAQASRVVNVGVAAHILAASPKGPRFDPNQSAEERAAIENAIWLCQTCAKLVDSDVDSFPTTRLRAWKVEAEAEALRSLSGTADAAVYPQADGRQHAPLPRIGGQSLTRAREQLIEAGWQPVINHWSYQEDPRILNGNGPMMWTQGFQEITDASGTGLAYCKFRYRDAYDNELVVVTAGELAEGSDVPVWSWKILTHERMVASEREYSRLAAQIRAEISRASESTEGSIRARGDLAIAAGALGGSRQKLYQKEAESRISQIHAAAGQLDTIEETIDAEDRGSCLPRLEAMLVQIAALGQRSAEDKRMFESELSELRRAR